MALLNYTTTITAGKTSGEMQGMLAKHGAQQVSIVYAAGEPAGLAFAIETKFGMRNFQLPANVPGVEETILRQQRAGQLPRGGRYQGTEHARRVAWRILKDWLAAQLAIIESGLADLDEVMLPYMLTAPGTTVIEAYRTSAGMRAALTAGRDESPTTTGDLS